ncbi:MAG TPA: cation transporter [Gemmatimonadaceae bacterium]|nr:cation transporter [Gemmatimonadaceae bacterium]
MTAPAAGHDQSLVLDITGMSCDHCVARVKKAVDSVAGVHTSDVGIGKATVSFDPSTVSADDIAASVTRAGYPARVKGAA